MATNSAYTGITDPEFLDLDASARNAWDKVSKKQAELDDLRKQWDLAAFTLRGGRAKEAGLALLQLQIDKLDKQVKSERGAAATYETRRENRGAALAQSGVNVQAGAAGAEAAQNENLLVRNIQQELTGRIARNTQQATEALTGIDTQSGAARGRVAAKAGQAGYDVFSGTGRALTEAAATRTEADKAAIEGYRIGRQNLLMGRQEAATKAAESLTGDIAKTTADWREKSTGAVSDVTGALISNVAKTAQTYGDLNGPGIQASQKAVETTLGTWSLEAYVNVLNTLTGRSANKSTWEQMLLEQAGAPENPYAQFGGGLDPLTPAPGVPMNMLAAATGTPDVYTSTLSGKKTGRLI